MSAPAARARRHGDDAIATPANLVTIARLVLAVPTLLLIVDRRIVARLEARTSAPQIERLLDAHLEPEPAGAT